MRNFRPALILFIVATLEAGCGEQPSSSNLKGSDREGDLDVIRSQVLFKASRPLTDQDLSKWQAKGELTCDIYHAISYSDPVHTGHRALKAAHVVRDASDQLNLSWAEKDGKREAIVFSKSNGVYDRAAFSYYTDSAGCRSWIDYHIRQAQEGPKKLVVEATRLFMEPSPGSKFVSCYFTHEASTSIATPQYESIAYMVCGEAQNSESK